MPVTVEAEGLGTIEFPDGTTDEEILGALPKLHEQVQTHDRIQGELRSQMQQEQRDQAPGQIVESALGGLEGAAGLVSTTGRRMLTAPLRAAHAASSALGLTKQPYIDPFEPSPELATMTQMGIGPSDRPRLNSDIIQPMPSQNEWGKALTGLTKSGVNLAGGIISDPAMLVSMGAGPGLGGAALQAGIGGQMAAHLPEASANAGTQLEDIRQRLLQGENPDTTPFWESAGDLAGTAAFTGGPMIRGGLGAVPQRTPVRPVEQPAIDPVEQKVRSIIRDEIKNAVQEVIQPKQGEVKIPENTPITPPVKPYEPNLLPEKAAETVAETPKPGRVSVDPKTDELLGANERGDPVYWSENAKTHYSVSNGRIQTGPWTEGLPSSAMERLDNLLSQPKETPNENQTPIQETKPAPEVPAANPKVETTTGSEVAGETPARLEVERLKGRLTAITEQFNKPRISKNDKASLIKQAEETRKEISRLGGTKQDIQDATYGKKSGLKATVGTVPESTSGAPSSTLGRPELAPKASEGLNKPEPIPAKVESAESQKAGEGERPKIIGMGGAVGEEFSKPNISELVTGKGESPSPKSEAQPKIDGMVKEMTGPTIGEKIKGFIQTLSGKSMPKTTIADRASGELGVRMASSRQAAKPMARVFVSDVLGGLDVNQSKFDAALKADNLLSIKDNFLRNALEAKTPEEAAKFEADANKVNTLIGQKEFPFKTESELHKYLNEPQVKEAVSRHKENWSNIIEPMYRQAQEIDPSVELPERGRYSGARVNLNPIVESEGRPAGKVVTSGSGNLTGTMKRRNPFARQAMGTGQKYVLDYNESMANTFAKSLEVSNKHEFEQRLQDAGLAVIGKPGMNMPGYKGYPYTRKPGSNIYVRNDIAGEYQRASNVELNPFTGNAAHIFNNSLNKAALTGLTDAFVHIQNVITAILQAPGATGKTLTDSLLAATGRADVPVILSRVLLKALKNNEKQIADLTEIGALRDYSPHGGFVTDAIESAKTKGGTSGKIAEALDFLRPINLINKTDRTVRLVLDDVYQGLSKEGLIKNTETNRREFVNAVGQYNIRLQGPIMRFFRQTGLGPFITAGRNFNVQGIKSMVLDPNVEASSLKSSARLKANVAAKWIGTYAVLVPTINYLITGKPMGRPGTPLGSVDTGKDDENGRHLTFSVSALTGQNRGPRITGARGYVEAKRNGLDNKTAADTAVRDMVNSIISPMAGPAIRFGSVAASGHQPAFGVNRISDVVPPGESQAYENLKSALIEASPISGSIHDATKPGGTASDALRRQLPRLTLQAGKSDQTMANYPKIVELAKAGEFMDDVVRRSRSMSQKEREQFVMDSLKRLPPDYTEHAIRTLNMRKIPGPWNLW